MKGAKEFAPDAIMKIKAMPEYQEARKKDEEILSRHITNLKPHN